MCADAAPTAGAVITAPPAVATILVEVVYAAAPHQIERVALRLPAGATAREALRASGLAERLETVLLDSLLLGLAGRPCNAATVLREQDRLELLRPLQVDPKEARRLRYRRDGLKKLRAKR